MTHRIRVHALALALALSASLPLAGCKAPVATFADEGRAYQASSLDGVLEAIDPGALANEKSSEAPRLRHEALVALRKQGDSATRAADLLTRTFPTATRAVPYYVESVDYEGTDAYVVIEATGREAGRLADRRLWVISEDGSVLLTRMR